MVRYHMIITCKPHGATLIGATEFRHAKSAPKSTRCVPDPLLLLGVGSGHESDNSDMPR